MPQSSILRALICTAALFLAVAIIWWVLGFQLGKGIMEELRGGVAFRRAYGFEQKNVLALLGLAFASVVTIGLYQAAPSGGKLLWLSGAALGAVVVLADPVGSAIGVAVTLFAVAAALETSGRHRLVAAAIGAFIAAFPFAVAQGLEGGAWAAAWAIRAVFFFFPLVWGAAWTCEQIARWLKTSAR